MIRKYIQKHAYKACLRTDELDEQMNKMNLKIKTNKMKNYMNKMDIICMISKMYKIYIRGKNNNMINKM